MFWSGRVVSCRGEIKIRKSNCDLVYELKYYYLVKVNLIVIIRLLQ